jgi:aspartate/methionine/tyrosine aminotransferase
MLQPGPSLGLQMPGRLATAHNAALVPPFHAMAMSRRATERALSGQSVFHLEVGQPSTPAPAAALEAGIAAMRSGPLGYSNALGLMSLRRRIVQHYSEWYGLDVPVDRVAIVSGASAGFSLAFLACFNPGQRVGVLEPGYPCYRNTLLALGVEPVAIPVGPASRWEPTAETLHAAGDLDGLIVASPSNPTGTILSAQTQAMLATFCEDNAVRLISDEIYHGITYAGPAASMLGLHDQAVIINSFSKYFSMTGWRLGWVVVPEDLVETFERLQQNLYICAPHISQVVGLAAFDCQPELDAHVVRYRSNRALLLEGLAAAGIDRVADADGAFYVYADVSHLTNDSLALCVSWLDQCGVAATPGIDFDTARGNSFVRFSYAGEASEIEQACRLIGSSRIECWSM